MNLKETDPVLYFLVDTEERKLALPENYRMRSITRLQRSLRRIEENLAIVSRGNWGPVGVPLRKLFRVHRKIILREMERRAAKGKGA